MRTITTYLVSIILVFSISISHAQDSTPENDNAEKIEILKELKNKIKIEEREFLKEEVEAINKRLENGQISESEAARLKKEAAENRALNIENRLAIVFKRCTSFSISLTYLSFTFSIFKIVYRECFAYNWFSDTLRPNNITLFIDIVKCIKFILNKNAISC